MTVDSCASREIEGYRKNSRILWKLALNVEPVNLLFNQAEGPPAAVVITRT
jgi:hypothetical protein